jgi:hypothetical protein
VLTGAQLEVEASENGVAAGDDVDLREAQVHAADARQRGGGRGQRVLGAGRLQRLHQAHGDVAQPGQLEGRAGEALADAGQRERPVGQQQRARGLAALAEVAGEQQDREAEAEARGQADGDHLQPGERAKRSRPLDQQALVFASQRALGAVGADGDEAEQRVEVKLPERAGVAADPQVALGHRFLQDHRRDQHADRREHDPGGAGGREPDQGEGGEEQVEEGAYEAREHQRDGAQGVAAVDALGHVGDRSAGEVAVAEAGDRSDEGDP